MRPRRECWDDEPVVGPVCSSQIERGALLPCEPEEDLDLLCMPYT